MWATSGWGITQWLEAFEVLVAFIAMAFFVCWVCYLVFSVLAKTIMDRLRILTFHGMRRATRPDLGGALHPFISDLELGPTMADGGEKTRDERRDTSGTVTKN